MADEPTVDQECVEGYLFAGRPPRYLVLRRPPERGRIWVPVSGKVERSDVDFAAAVQREIAEETGFSRPKSVFPLEWRFRFQGPDGRNWRLHAFGVELDAEQPPRLSSEHDLFEWMAFEAARDRLHYPDNREALVRLDHRLRTSP